MSFYSFEQNDIYIFEFKNQKCHMFDMLMKIKVKILWYNVIKIHN